MKHRASTLTAGCGIVAALAAGDVAALQDWMVVFRRGESIYAQGEPGDGLYIIVFGKVKLSRLLAGGRRQVVVVGPSDIFGASSTLEGATQRHGHQHHRRGCGVHAAGRDPGSYH